MKRIPKLWSWFWLGLGCFYFLLPLLATFLFSLKRQKDILSFLAYQNIFHDPNFIHSFTFSVEMAVLTILAGFALVVPTTFLINWKFPRIRPWIEACTMLPFVIPPIVLVFGFIRLYSRPPLALISNPLILVAGYIVLAFPYIFRSIDTGLRSMDIRSLMEASLSLGASPLATFFEVILPSGKNLSFQI